MVYTARQQVRALSCRSLLSLFIVHSIYRIKFTHTQTFFNTCYLEKHDVRIEKLEMDFDINKKNKLTMKKIYASLPQTFTLWNVIKVGKLMQRNTK